ncbi:MAG: ABC transporter ATP-binding protein [Deltaproteobacteria bacterium HGW-Deltaproteobacteria-15]|jgi:branched-chain amino acid transport system ATP-binding protein|nr:MAG: ABC transporter ATP-binding protein [Deltaproteobacteria bacterium HGW-Deltaproteobacteria-15]
MMPGDVLLDIQGVFKDFRGVEVIRNLSLKVRKGERHAVIGPNGAGKTTLFNLITGRYTPTSGNIFFKGRRISGLSPHRINRLGISRSFQITNLFPGLSVFENIRSAVLSKKGIRWSLVRRVDRMKDVNEETAAILSLIHLSSQSSRLAGSLDYGAQRALEIGISLATDPELIMLDEPTAGMSIEETREIVRMVDTTTRGKALVIIEHDMEVVFSLADTITVIHYGTVLASGSPAEIRNDSLVKEAYLGERWVC